MSNSFEKAIAKMSPQLLEEIIDFSKAEAQRIKEKLYVVPFPEKITVYYLEVTEVEVDDTNEVHIPKSHLELKVSVVGNLGEAEALDCTFVRTSDVKFRPVVGQKFELQGTSIWQQIAEKLLSNTLPKSFFDPEPTVKKVQVPESDDV